MATWAVASAQPTQSPDQGSGQAREVLQQPEGNQFSIKGERIVKKNVLNFTGVLLLMASALQTLSGQSIRGANDTKAQASGIKSVSAPTALTFPTLDVNVVNTPDVNIANTPVVTVGNSPSVNVTNTPNVKITNTGTQPVLNSSIDDPGRIPFQQQIALNNGECSGAATCLFTFRSVPAGHRLVVQHISGLVSYSGTPFSIIISLYTPNSGVPLSAFFAPLTGPDTSLTAFDQPVLAYIDPPLVSGAFFGVRVDLGPGRVTSGGQVMTMSGYMLDCTAAPCATLFN
jgi:hypothetical protein